MPRAAHPGIPDEAEAGRGGRPEGTDIDQAGCAGAWWRRAALRAQGPASPASAPEHVVLGRTERSPAVLQRQGWRAVSRSPEASPPAIGPTVRNDRATDINTDIRRGGRLDDIGPCDGLVDEYESGMAVEAPQGQGCRRSPRRCRGHPVSLNSTWPSRPMRVRAADGDRHSPHQHARSETSDIDFMNATRGVRPARPGRGGRCWRTARGARPGAARPHRCRAADAEFRPTAERMLGVADDGAGRPAPTMPHRAGTGWSRTRRHAVRSRGEITYRQRRKPSVARRPVHRRASTTARSELSSICPSIDSRRA